MLETCEAETGPKNPGEVANVQLVVVWMLCGYSAHERMVISGGSAAAPDADIHCNFAGEQIQCGMMAAVMQGATRHR